MRIWIGEIGDADLYGDRFLGIRADPRYHRRDRGTAIEKGKIFHLDIYE